MAAHLQDLIYKFEEGTGSRYVRYALGIIFFLAVATTYNLAAFRNLQLPEGMDAAQVARNIAQGEGFTTDVVRPLSLHLLSSRAGASRADTSEGAPAAAPLAEMTGPHPDLANPPLYPLLLSPALKFMPSSFYAIRADQRFEVFGADRWIGMFNQGLMCVAACLVFVLARKLFDEPVAWVSALLFVGADVFWQFSLSGLPTMLLTVIFLALVLVLTQLDAAARDEDAAGGRLMKLAVTAGLLVGLGALTRYSFAWAMVPVGIFMIVLPGKRQGVLVASAVAMFVIVLGPWLARNYHFSGTVFGTAGFSLYQETPRFPGSEIQRTLDPQLGEIRGGDLVDKLFRNARLVIEDELPRLGGSWMGAFFLVGLLIPFRSPARGAMRMFVLACGGVFIVVQSLARTSGGEAIPSVSAENLLVILTPLVIVYGTSLFFLLLDQATQVPWIRYVASGSLWLVISAPLIFTFMAPPVSAVNYPPYYPPWIKEKSQRLGVGEAIMTDMPWAVAWYGERRAVWLSLLYSNGEADRIREDFAALDALHPVEALYLSGLSIKELNPESLHAWRAADADMEDFILLRGMLTGNWEEGGDTRDRDMRLLGAFRNGIQKNWLDDTAVRQDWETFIVGVLMKQEVPSGFPLSAGFEELLPEIFLTDSERITTKPIQSE